MVSSRIRIPTLRQIVRWGVGIPRSTAEYLWRRRTIERHDSDAATVRGFPDEQRPLPAGELPLTHPSDGSGPAFHRTYSVRVVDAQCSATELIRRIGANPNSASPAHVARFEKTAGVPEILAVGDEFDIELAGPWNGPVRVIETGMRRFRLGTLEGHIESGEIEFRCAPAGRQCIDVTIESWARSSDAVVGVLYDGVGIAREVQMNMWAHFLEGAAQLAGGRVDGDIRVDTERTALSPT